MPLTLTPLSNGRHSAIDLVHNGTYDHQSGGEAAVAGGTFQYHVTAALEGALGAPPDRLLRALTKSWAQIRGTSMK